MAIKLVKIGVSTVVGAADILAEYIDEKKAYGKAFQNFTDWGRTLYTVGGYVANSMDLLDSEITETAVLSGIPLFIKSLKKATHEYVLKPMGRKGRMGLHLKSPGRGSPDNIRYG